MCGIMKSCVEWNLWIRFLIWRSLHQNIYICNCVTKGATSNAHICCFEKKIGSCCPHGVGVENFVTALLKNVFLFSFSQKSPQEASSAFRNWNMTIQLSYIFCPISSYIEFPPIPLNFVLFSKKRVLLRTLLLSNKKIHFKAFSSSPNYAELRNIAPLVDFPSRVATSTLKSIFRLSDCIHEYLIENICWLNSVGAAKHLKLLLILIVSSSAVVSVREKATFMKTFT